MTTDQKLKLKEAGNFLNAVIVDEDMFNDFINAGIINTAVAESNTQNSMSTLKMSRTIQKNKLKN